MTELVAAPRARPLGWWGMATFVAGEAALFGVMIATYFYLRFKNLVWPPHGVPEPNVVVPLVLLGVLLATSVPVQAAVRAGRAGRVGAVRRLVALALVVQAGYFAMSVHEYLGDLSRFSASEHAYGSIYFLLLGADHAHVALGLLFDVWLLGKLTGGLTRYRSNALGAIGLYWHAVNAITLAVTLTVLSAAL